MTPPSQVFEPPANPGRFSAADPIVIELPPGPLYQPRYSRFNPHEPVAQLLERVDFWLSQRSPANLAFAYRHLVEVDMTHSGNVDVCVARCETTNRLLSLAWRDPQNLKSLQKMALIDGLRGVRGHPYSPRAQEAFAASCMLRGWFRVATKYFDKAPKLDRAATETSAFYLAFLFATAQQDHALKLLRQAAGRRSNDVFAQAYYAFGLHIARQHNHAHGLMVKALELDRSSWLVRLLLCMHWIVNGESEQACRQCQAMLGLLRFPDQAGFLYALKTLCAPTDDAAHILTSNAGRFDDVQGVLCYSVFPGYENAVRDCLHNVCYRKLEPLRFWLDSLPIFDRLRHTPWFADCVEAQRAHIVRDIAAEPTAPQDEL